MVRPSLPPVERIPGGRTFASVSRRVRTLIVAVAAFVVLFILALTLPVPYVVLSPGPTYNTLGKDDGGNQIITIDGRTARNTAGHLNLTTVSVTTQTISAFQAFSGWLAHDEVVVPRSAVYPPGESQQQTDQQNTRDFTQSQDSATAAAFCELGYPRGFGVIEVADGSPSLHKLRAGDQFVSVNGRNIGTRKQLDAVLSKLSPGATATIVVKRAARTVTERVTLGRAPKVTGQAQRTGGYLGVVPDDTCLAPFTVDLGLGQEIGGPSAGLMFALGIMDKIGPTDLTKGRFIAGTGTIDSTGAVGPIGGIALKMIAAKAKGATVFLAPAGNCADVRKSTPGGLNVIKVSSLHGAVQDLLDIESGRAVPHC